MHTILYPDAARPGMSGHCGWAFRGLCQFEARAARFLADGFERGERLLFVADDPNPGRWPAWLLRGRSLEILSSTEAYGPDLVVDAARQRARLAGALAQALHDGYSGMCVIADNTALVASSERLAAWLCWEAVADAFMDAHPVTGLCAFDATRLDAVTLASALAPHALQLDG